MSGTFVAPELNRELSYHLIEAPMGFFLFCDAGQFFDELSDASASASSIRTMIESGGEMTVEGGIQTEMPKNTLEHFGEEGPTYSYFVDGVFPRWNVPVHVNIGPYSLNASVFTKIAGVP